MITTVAKKSNKQKKKQQTNANMFIIPDVHQRHKDNANVDGVQSCASWREREGESANGERRGERGGENEKGEESEMER